MQLDPPGIDAAMRRQCLHQGSADAQPGRLAVWLTSHTDHANRGPPGWRAWFGKSGVAGPAHGHWRVHTHPAARKGAAGKPLQLVAAGICSPFITSVSGPRRALSPTLALYSTVPRGPM